MVGGGVRSAWVPPPAEPAACGVWLQGALRGNIAAPLVGGVAIFSGKRQNRRRKYRR